MLHCWSFLSENLQENKIHYPYFLENIRIYLTKKTCKVIVTSEIYSKITI